MARMALSGLLIALLLVTLGCGTGSSVKPAQPILRSTTLLITSISPTSAAEGSPDLALTVMGSSFLKNAQFFTEAVWSANGTQTPLASTYINSTQLTAVIPAGLLKNSVSAQIFVQNIDQDGTPRATSTTLSFNVTSTGLTSSGFTATGGMMVARSGHSATLLPTGMVLVVGGVNHLGVLVSAEVYDPAKGAFTATGNLSTARQGHTATLLADGKVLIAGGEDNVGPIRSAELYDPVTGQFSTLGDMNNARWSHTATLLKNAKVLITGGADNTDSQDSAELFDPASGSFAAIENMQSPRMHHTATLLANGKVLLVGGWSSYSPITSLASAELFDPTTTTFTSAGSMSIPRNRHRSALLPDGRVLILGGSEHQFSVSSIEAFDPVSNTFVGAGGLRTTRTSHTVTLLLNGTVLIAGGVDIFSGPDAPESTVLASSELYIPASQSSLFTGPLQNSRTGHTATLLKNGAVLVVGGVDNTGDVLASAELYQ
jgi:hypothetical protein